MTMHRASSSDPRFPDDLPLAEARARVHDQLADGVTCPCCTQTARAYRRPMTSVAARGLAALWREHGTRYGHMPTVARRHLADVASQGGYLVLAHHWRLMVSEPAVRPDGGRTGFWAVTTLGERWLHGRVTVPGRAVIYNGVCLRLEGDPVTVRDVLGTGFDLAELLGERDGGAQVALFGRVAA